MRNRWARENKGMERGPDDRFKKEAWKKVRVVVKGGTAACVDNCVRKKGKLSVGKGAQRGGC